ncbi:MAG: rhodanese-like domain-containing protein [Yoonia sp.]|nr:rhodanese-like domain-containing protein [Yoonia sp.]
MFSRNFATALAVGAGLGTSLIAQANANVIKAGFTIGGVEKTFQQSQSLNSEDISAFHNPSAVCAPLCIAPLSAAAGVQTVGEREVIGFVADVVSQGNGLLIDSREPEDRAAGFIPASVNVPASLVQADNPFLTDIMHALGARSFEGTLNFSDAMPLIIFDDGPSTSVASGLITQLITQGYPADKLSYYRGGMLVWTALGLNTEDAKS